MHDLFAQVLDHRDLSKAGDLFSVEDKDIVDDLSNVLKKVEEISSSSDYKTSDNDQSVVEICITRVTSAIRETSSIEIHAAALVSLLDTCLQHDLQPSAKDEDTPHAKIASDVMSCVFLNYSKRSVMYIAIPVAVKFLKQGNKELIRNVSSYLSLAAIDHAQLLTKYVEPIIDSITNGNYSLVRVLPQVYTEDKENINTHISTLVDLLDKCELADKNGLVSLFCLVTKHNSKLLVPHISKLCEFLKSNVLSSAILQIFVDMSIDNATSFINHVATLKDMVKTQPANLGGVVKIIGAIGRQNEPQAVVVMDYLVKQLQHADLTTVLILLREIKCIAELYQSSLDPYIDDILKHSVNASASSRSLVQQISEIHTNSHPEKEAERSSWSHTENRITVISVGQPSPKTHAMKQATAGNTASSGSVFTSASNSINGTPTRSVTSKVIRPYSVISNSSAYSEKTMVSGTSATTFNSFSTYPIKDTVQHFCEKHLVKIKTFIDNVSARLPLPVKCTMEGQRRDKKKYAKVHFVCKEKGDQCLYSKNFFPMKTKYPKIWIHIMFLHIQAQSSAALSSHEPIVASLKETWENMKVDGNSSFVRLVTSSFPSSKDQDNLRHELSNWRYFDVFEFNAVKKSWACFLCNHPEKASGLLQDGHPTIEGQLKEKKGRWKFFKRWKTRYFTLSGAQMTYTCSKSDSRRETLPVSKIQSVKAVKKGHRDIPKAFEIFTNDQTYVLKAKDGKNAEQWVQCLHIAWARSNNLGRWTYTVDSTSEHNLDTSTTIDEATEPLIEETTHM